MVRNAFGSLGSEEATFIPEMERPKAYREARIWLVIYAAVTATAVATRSSLPLMLVGLPSFTGAWFYLFTGLTQHAGLAEDVLDHRPQLAHGTDEPGAALPLLEHELSRGAPHVPDGAVPRAADAACRDSLRTAVHLFERVVGLPGDHPYPLATAEGSDPLHCHELPPAMAEHEATQRQAA